MSGSAGLSAMLSSLGSSGGGGSYAELGSILSQLGGVGGGKERTKSVQEMRGIGRLNYPTIQHASTPEAPSALGSLDVRRFL